MTPIEHYEAQQRAFEQERYKRLMRETHVDRVYTHEQMRPLTEDEIFDRNHPSKTQNSFTKEPIYQPEPAPFCAPYGEKDAEPGALVWLGRVLFVAALAAAFYTAARWLIP